MRVKATRTGYYGLLLRRAGTIFNLVTVKGKDAKGNPVTYTPKEQFSPKWMEAVESDEDVVSHKSQKKTRRAEQEEDNQEVI